MPKQPDSSADDKPRWSQDVTAHSDAMDLAPDVFTLTDPQAIAKSLKASAEHSDRRKSDPYRSAMSMLTFYTNRAGHRLEPPQHEILESAKDSLRTLFGRPPARRAVVKKTTTGEAAAKKVAKKVAREVAEKPARKAPGR